jgi:hypothetical protein
MAADSTGKALPTHYEWSGTTVTQVVDISDPSIVYPVALATSWAYTMDFNVERNGPTAIWNYMHGCFNCFFPVDGAPHNWPSLGQDLPLTVLGIGNFHCTYNWEDNFLPVGFDFRFESASGHVDGDGSMIQFTVTDDGSPTHLQVFAITQNDFPEPVKATYMLGAQQTWQQFADNIGSIITT